MISLMMLGLTEIWERLKKKLYGHRGKNIMNTDIKEHDEGYELYMDLPALQKTK